MSIYFTTMSDNKLRCTLVYRLDGSRSSDAGESGDGIAMSKLSPGAVTLVAKYDYGEYCLGRYEEIQPAYTYIFIHLRHILVF